MNAPIDTDERRARPSVWPVYVAAGAIGVAGLSYALIGIWGELAYGGNGGAGVGVFFGLVGALGVAVAWGLFRLRPGAWWCALVLVVLWIAYAPMIIRAHLQTRMKLSALFDDPRMAAVPHDLTDFAVPSADFIAFAALCLIVPLLVILVLATRRQLFFPPKAEGEDQVP